MLDTTPPNIRNFGFHNPYEQVKLAAMFLKHWNLLPYPGGVFDQPIELLYDIIRYINLRDEVHDLRDKGYTSVQAIREMLSEYQEQEIYDEPIMEL